MAIPAESLDSRATCEQSRLEEAVREGRVGEGGGGKLCKRERVRE